MRILIACEYSGISRRAFESYGHEVVSADFEAAEDRAFNHYQGDVFDLVKNSEPFDMMLAHPPCTYLCSSGLHWNTRGVMVEGRPRAELTEEALEFVRRLLELPIKHKAIENPKGCISTRIRKFDQKIQPYWFGDDASKETFLWLENLPSLRIPPERFWVKPREVIYKGKLVRRWGNQTDSGNNNAPETIHRWKDRSRTYPGIANSWAKQWSFL